MGQISETPIKRLKILWEEGLDENTREIVTQGLLREYLGILIEVIQHGELAIPSHAYSESRDQVNCEILLESLFLKIDPLFLVLLYTDIFAPRFNFLFGQAWGSYGAVCSVARLQNDPVSIRKEAIHEVGHVLGLKHCKLPCVMTFSNSYAEALLKEEFLCDRCGEQLRKKHSF